MNLVNAWCLKPAAPVAPAAQRHDNSGIAVRSAAFGSTESSVINHQSNLNRKAGEAQMANETASYEPKDNKHLPHMHHPRLGASLRA